MGWCSARVWRYHLVLLAWGDCSYRMQVWFIHRVRSYVVVEGWL